MYYLTSPLLPELSVKLPLNVLELLLISENHFLMSDFFPLMLEKLTLTSVKSGHVPNNL